MKGDEEGLRDAFQYIVQGVVRLQETGFWKMGVKYLKLRKKDIHIMKNLKTQKFTNSSHFSYF